ncbi:MAG: peptidoglycan recognition protein family protein [Actinomycetota bacterium]
MGRRLFILVLLTAIAVVGVPFPSSARSAPPETVTRDLAVEPGTIRTSARVGAWLERSIELPIDTNMVAASFDSPHADHESLEEVVVEGRFRSATGWSEWQQLVIEPDEAPDRAEAARASKRVFAGPIWVGTAGAMQLRYFAPAGSAPAKDLKLHLINSLGNASKPNLLQRVVGSVSSFFRGTKAHAMTVQPGIITRAGWGANESIRECCPRYATAVNMAFVHHTAGSNSYSSSESPAIVRSIYAYHVKNRGWSDIGYNFLVDKYGQIFEGRYGGMTLPVIGAHVLGFNTGSTGISLMGTFSTVSPTSNMVASLKNLLAWKMDVHHIPPVGTVVMTSGGSDLYPVGKKKTFNRISGHRDGQQTTCPGGRVYNLLPSIRTAVSQIGLPKLYLPTASTSLVSPDGDGLSDTVTLTGTFTTTVLWKVQLRWPDGTLIKEFAGTGTSLSGVTWNGLDADGTLTKGGVVKWSISAADLAGKQVRPAEGTFSVMTPYRLSGDWDGDGDETPATVIGRKWFLHNDFDGEPDVEFLYGNPTDRPVAGDWDGNGTATPGVVRGNWWFLNNTTDATGDIVFPYGNPGDVPLAGDWNGDGKDSVGVVRGNAWYLNDNFDGFHDGAAFFYGNPTDAKLAGDWNGDGIDSAGVVRGITWYLNNNRDGFHDVDPFLYGSSTDAFVVGQWEEHGQDPGIDVAGVFRDPRWYLRDENAQGDAVIVFIDLS